jgi:hypothetical protein
MAVKAFSRDDFGISQNRFYLNSVVNFDVDATAYIAAVEAADGEALEASVKNAINDFIVGLKADGIWSAVLASCIMMGARTLTGALTPLKGTAPTSVNFVIGDYNRKTGLKGNGSNKYVDTNFLDSSTYRLDIHIAVFQTTDLTGTGGARAVIAARNNSGAGGSNQIIKDNSENMTAFNRAGSQDGIGGSEVINSFIGTSRGASGSFIYRHKNTGASVTRTADASTSGVNYRVYTREGSPLWSAGRYSFYTVGAHIDATGLANYESRVTTLYNAISAAIP